MEAGDGAKTSGTQAFNNKEYPLRRKIIVPYDEITKLGES